MEGFVKACVTAIEARDPVTSGHSMRVSDYTVGLAEAVNRTETGPLSGIYFTPAQMRELRYATMLHDVGKIGVKEEILQKRHKLLPHELEIISMRLRLMRAEMMLVEKTRNENHSEQIRRLDTAWSRLLEASEPSVPPTVTFELLRDLKALKICDDTGVLLTALTEDESQKLLVSKGTL